jgi:acetyl esterase/lipase
METARRRDPRTVRQVRMTDRAPYLEIRIGEVRLTLQRRPVRLLTAGAVVLLLMGGGWVMGDSGPLLP